MDIFKHRPARIVLHVLTASCVALGIFWWIRDWWWPRPPATWHQGSSAKAKWVQVTSAS